MLHFIVTCISRTWSREASGRTRTASVFLNDGPLASVFGLSVRSGFTCVSVQQLRTLFPDESVASTSSVKIEKGRRNPPRMETSRFTEGRFAVRHRCHVTIVKSQRFCSRLSQPSLLLPPHARKCHVICYLLFLFFGF